MPVVTFDYQDFIALLGHKISKEELIEKLPMIGADVDSVDGDAISIEFFPNRPDLTSVEGIVRAARAFFGYKTGLTVYPLKSSDVMTTVDLSVKTVRPFIATALVKKVNMTDALIRSLMDVQEKLHLGLGRNRKKVAIGVHNVEPVTPPFTYKAVDPQAISFVPLGKTEPMTLLEILQKHEKGVAYAHLLKEYDRYPLIVDAHHNVLSFPPIINGCLTEVTPFTKDLFIDVTGTDSKAVHYALNIISTALAERGGEIHTTTIHDGKTSLVSPNLDPVKKPLSVSYVNATLGTTLNEQQIIDCLAKMGYHVTASKKDVLSVMIPGWRADILHEIDLVEDVAIGYGFDRFATDFVKDLTFGKPLPLHGLCENLRSIMIGLGYNEVATFTISNERSEFTKMGLPQNDCVKIENPIGEDYSCLRVSLLPSMLSILNENRHHPLPQQIFELGFIVDQNAKNRRHLAAVKIDAKANFTSCKSLIEAVCRDIGISYEIQDGKHPAFIPGRCASLRKENVEIGVFGELHPRTISAFSLEHPIIAFELSVDSLNHP